MGQTTAWGTIGLYGLTHAAVDAVCVGLLWAAVHRGTIAGAAAWSVFFLYNLLAFALQPLIGIGADRAARPRSTAVLGAALVAAAALAAVAPGGIYAALVLMGIGNAVFHVGGGIVALGSAPGRAAPVGVFVAPGAAGVLIGTLLGRDGGPVWIAAAALFLLLPALLRAPLPRFRTRERRHDASPRNGVAALELILPLLLLVVVLRSYVGFALAFPWKIDLPLLILLTAAVVLGKALGGFLADRFGWRLIGVGALLLSAPLLVLGGGAAGLGIAGALIFNMTMPVTLAASARAIPGHEGLAFGLTCLALFAGSVPSLAGWTGPASGPVLALTAALAAAALWAGLGGVRFARARPASGHENSTEGSLT